MSLKQHDTASAVPEYDERLRDEQDACIVQAFRETLLNFYVEASSAFNRTPGYVETLLIESGALTVEVERGRVQ